MKQFFLTSLLLTGLTFAQTEAPRQKPLSEIELIALLATGSPSERLAWLVRNRGIDFASDEAFLKSLKDDGAEDALLTLLKSGDAKREVPSAKDPATSRKESAALVHLHLAARANRNNFHPQEAEPECRAAARADPANAFVHLAWGNVIERIGNRDEAIAEFRTALTLQPDLAEAHLILGDALLRSHRQEALEHLKQAVTLAPSDAQFHYDYAIALEVNGDKEAGAEQRKIAARLGYSPTFQRIRVGGRVMGAKIVSQRRPEYPREAMAAHIIGVVRMDVLVGKDGAVKDVALISGAPILFDAAMKAVLEWRYQPTLLNGRPFEVVTEVDVNFK